MNITFNLMVLQRHRGLTSVHSHRSQDPKPCPKRSRAVSPRRRGISVKQHTTSGWVEQITLTNEQETECLGWLGVEDDSHDVVKRITRLVSTFLVLERCHDKGLRPSDIALDAE